MTLPLFPLQLVVFPGEQLPLHIFEERYRELIKDCEARTITFGVPTYIDNRLEYGTEVTLKEIAKRYPGGESDVLCTGLRVFRIKNFYNTLPDKLYAGGAVEFFEDIDDTSLGLQEELLEVIDELYLELDIDNPPQFTIPVMSYQVAHKVGLAIDQEYHLLKLRSEQERLTYIIGHLTITIPVVRQMNRTREMIKLNGHFKNFDPLDFEGLES